MTVKERIIFEDNHLILVNKLAGELVQGDHTGDQPLLEKVREYIRVTYEKPGNVFCGLIHRLDRPTSGIVAFAKTGKALERMNKSFAERAVDKRYYAAVGLAPPQSGQLTHYLKKDQKRNKSFATQQGNAGAKQAKLRYEQIAKSDRYFLLEVELYTGRHHQIRVQLAKAGFPIKGDLKYGFPRSNPDGSISLHAGALSFAHPVGGEPVKAQAPCLSKDPIWATFNPILLSR